MAEIANVPGPAMQGEHATRINYRNPDETETARYAGGVENAHFAA
jgi:hypothetical protein